MKRKNNNIYPFAIDRLYKKARIVIHANLALSILIGQLMFVAGIDTKPKVDFYLITSCLILFHIFKRKYNQNDIS